MASQRRPGHITITEPAQQHLPSTLFLALQGPTLTSSTAHHAAQPTLPWRMAAAGHLWLHALHRFCCRPFQLVCRGWLPLRWRPPLVMFSCPSLLPSVPAAPAAAVASGCGRCCRYRQPVDVRRDRYFDDRKPGGIFAPGQVDRTAQQLLLGAVDTVVGQEQAQAVCWPGGPLDGLITKLGLPAAGPALCP